MLNKAKAFLRRWADKLFGIKRLDKLVKENNNKAHNENVEKWKAIYAGYYDKWHKVKYNTIDGQKSRKMHTLNMGKVVSEELAKLIFNEKVEVNISDDQLSEFIEDVFKHNRFYKVFQSNIEKMFALGGLVLKGHVENDKIKITYVTPDCFIPISYSNGEVIEAAFLNFTTVGKKVYCLIELHEWVTDAHSDSEGSKVYMVSNELYVSENGSEGNRVPLETLYPNLEEETLIRGLENPLFQYIKPNIANNLDIQSPLGVSVFANSEDTLYALDIAFDSFIREFRLGKKRIIVPASAVRSVVDPQTGQVNRYFDATDEIYEAFNLDETTNNKIVDNSVTLRVQEHISAINSLLDILSMQVGFSAGTFTFDGQGVKTATEVVSEKSKTFQTKQSNENLLEEGLIKFIIMLTDLAALYDLFNKPEEFEIELAWDDSIIQDRDSNADFYLKLANSGLITKEYALQKILDFTEEQAQEMVEKIKEERASNTPTIEEMYNLE